MGIGDDITKAFQTVTNDAGQVVNQVTSAVGDLAGLGISCPEYVIQLFLDEGWDAVQAVATVYREISSAGYDCAAFFETLVVGCQQYGSPRAFLAHLARRQAARILPDLAEMVQSWGGAAQQPIDMLAEIDALLAQHPQFGAGAGAQGAMAETFATRYQEIKTNITRMAAPMASAPSSPWDGRDYGRDLNNIWHEFETECESRLTSEFHDGTLGLRLVGVVVCIAAIVYADSILAVGAAALAGPSFGTSVPVGAGVIVGWDLIMVCLAFECLNLLGPFIKMLLELLGLLIDMVIVAPLTYVWHEIQSAFAATGASGTHVLTPGERGKAVQDAWDETEKALKKLGKVMDDLIKVIGDAALVKKLMELLVCMGYGAAQIAELLTSLTLNLAINAPYTLPPCASPGMLIKKTSDTLLGLLRRLLTANEFGNDSDYTGLARVLKAIMDIGVKNVAGIDVVFKNPSSPGSDADIIDTNGNIYEVGGPKKVGTPGTPGTFLSQYQADADFIENCGTGNKGGNVNLWLDADNATVEEGKKQYEKPGLAHKKVPTKVEQKAPPAWQCGTGYKVGSAPTPVAAPAPGSTP